MQISLSYKKTNHFNSLIYNYLNREDYTKELYGHFPSKKNILKQSNQKLAHYSNREVLVSALYKQNQNLNLSPKQKENLEKLAKPNTATIATGHQLNLLTGPIYFLYKILETLKLCEELSHLQKKTHFVPIFWMASEDHDWQEINHLYYKQKKNEWKKSVSGSVGDVSLDGIDGFFTIFFDQLHSGLYKQELIDLIKKCYLENSTTLAEATRKLLHTLFKEYGLLILDGNDKELKKLAIPYFSEELQSKTVFENISQTNLLLPKTEIQAYAREINLFYKEKNSRERIIETPNGFGINNHPEILFSKEEILSILRNEPEKFSPNVLMRPLYQEIVLPNAAYIGGAGEISYWLQLKSYFDSQQIPFPILIPRNSVLLISRKQLKKMELLKISFHELFLSADNLINKKIKDNYTLTIDFKQIRKEIGSLYDSLAQKAIKTEKTFGYLLEAQKTRQLKAIDALEKRLLKAEKIKHKEIVERIIDLKQSLFPLNNLQERTLNFSELYLDYGPALIPLLYQNINPTSFAFTIKQLD
jgi:bacillithiol synthase